MERHITISLSWIILIVGFGIGLLIVPLVVKAASGSVNQTTYTDFTQCTTLTGTISTPLFHSTQASSANNNILLVTTNFTDDFSGTNLNTSLWDSGNWHGTNVPLVGSSILTIPTGTWVHSADDFTYGMLEFEAEFGLEENHHIGFASNDFAGSRFFFFSTYTSTTNLFARVNNNEAEQRVDLGPIPTGMHLYRIEWKLVNPNTDHVDFYMDGNFQAGFDVSSNNATVEARNFFVYMSNDSPIASALQVGHIRLLPGYFPGGFYTSCALDAGVGNGWQAAGWNAALPAQTGVALEARTSLTGSTWSDWQIVSNGGVINTLGRYAQYRLNLASTNVLTTPLIDSVVLTYNTAPSLSINDVTVTEGTVGPVNAVFSVTLSNPISQTAVVSYTTANGTAVSPDDYIVTTGTLTFTPGITTQNITVTVQADALDENDETFFVNLSGATNVNVVSDSQGQATITDDDAPPNLSINDDTVNEGTGSPTSAVFNVSLSAPSGKTVTVNYATANGTAISPADYTSITTSTLIFAPGIITRPLTVTVQADTLDENDETFFVNLSGATNVNVVSDSQGQATITDDDAPPNLSINDVSVTEGSNGTVNAVFTVSLSPQSGKTVTVNYATADNTAAAPLGDYITSTGTLTFAPGSVTKTISIAVNGDGTTEADETFFVNLSGAINAGIGDPQGSGTILNDDVPGVAVIQSGSSTNVTEGGATDSYQVYLTNQPSASVVITPTTNGQITALPTPLTFTPATWFIPQTVTVTAVNDEDIEANPHTTSITHTISSTDPSYNSLSVSNVAVSITENDFAGVTVTQSGGSTNVVEAGATDTYQVKLTGKPSANVVITLTPDTQTTTLPTSLTFTSLNWSVAQTVTVTAVDDEDSESAPQTSAITQTAASSDTNYNGLSIPNVVVNITDDDGKLFLPIILN